MSAGEIKLANETIAALFRDPDTSENGQAEKPEESAAGGAVLLFPRPLAKEGGAGVDIRRVNSEKFEKHDPEFEFEGALPLVLFALHRWAIFYPILSNKQYRSTSILCPRVSRSKSTIGWDGRKSEIFGLRNLEIPRNFFFTFFRLYIARI